jgi:hypothetical protein
MVATQSDKGEKKEARNFLRLNTKCLLQIRAKNAFVECPAHRTDYTNFFKIFPLFPDYDHQQRFPIFSTFFIFIVKNVEAMSMLGMK